MNIIFFGSSRFAVPSLDALVKAGHTISCVVTQPDRRKGRGLHVEGTPVKTAALRAGFEVLQPAVLNAPGPHDVLSHYAADLFIVIAYGQILSGDILGIPAMGAINAHASLLPRYRGAAPINWAIIKGEQETGVTIIRMNTRMDAGDILLREVCPIAEDDTAVTLEEKLARISARLIVQAVSFVAAGLCRLMPQDARQVVLAPKLRKETGLIHWDKPARVIHNVIRGCLDWPGAYTWHEGKLLKIFRSSVAPACGEKCKAPGQICAADKCGILISTGNGCLRVEELQPAGRRRMSAREFITGHRIVIGEKFGAAAVPKTI